MNWVESLRPQWRWALVLALVVVVVFSRLVAGWFLNTYSVVNDSGVALKPWGQPAQGLAKDLVLLYHEISR